MFFVFNLRGVEYKLFLNILLEYTYIFHFFIILSFFIFS